MLSIKKDNINLNALQKVIEFFGSQVKLAKQLKIQRQYVNAWCKQGDDMPFKYAYEIERLTEGKITARNLMIKVN